MTIFFITALIFSSYYLFAFRLKFDCPHQKIILAGLGGFGQIILTQLSLGITGFLYLPYVMFLNVMIALTVIGASGVLVKGGCLALQDELKRTIGRIRNIFTPLNFFLFILIGYLIIWIGGTIYLYPYRDYDVLDYHLPSIYEYILNHKIFLLPVEFNLRFAFPENAELLFMWPAIFFHSQPFIAGVQLIVAAWGSVVLYGLARMVGIHPRNSLFISLLFLLTPVVMSQMASCYIDLISTAFTLTVLYAAGMFSKTNRLIYFYSTALAAGLLWGMKYNEILIIPIALPFLFWPKPVAKRHWVGFIVIFLIAGGYWYLRNLLVFRSPVYPMPYTNDSFLIYGHVEQGTFVEFFKRISYKLLFIWKDIGLGSVCGGLGLIFWGLAVPAWFYVWIRAIMQKKLFDLWLYSSFIIGIGQLFLANLNDFTYLLRYSLFVVGLGLLALGEVMMNFDKIAFFRKIIKTLCVLFSLLAIVHLSINRPTYRIDMPFRAFVKGRYLSREAFYSKSLALWGLLDYLTVNDPQGLTSYIATTDVYMDHFISAGYGTNLQNRIWDLEPNKDRQPDAFIYSLEGKKEVLKKSGPAITLEEMMNNSAYLLVYRYSGNYLFIRKSFFNDPEKKKLLDGFYRVYKTTRPA